ncbi:TMEM165/GDT1 family protein [Actinocrinis puniceicyclus]|uniref:GDT1 family protein n=1 Tax=Actinocrinis puniceicyclus TaxID=977794 RepID=A0A8J7WGW0_9ACTN|nr:TMEM165/GDT1 family protein [Actinocrinis puniceicyclus]MBS2961948.1 TMEM165/GDT1 family protein [Actinocrinis puniceicyclus]
MNAAVIATTFGVVFLAELPDKTALASLVLATKYRARDVFLGASSGFAVQVVIALAAGKLLSLLPHRVLEAVVAGLFLLGAVLIYRHADQEEEDQREAQEAAEAAGPVSGNGNGTRRAILTSFTVITVAEFGDLTQIVTANLAAKYDWLQVGIGALVALWTVAALAILGGQALLRVVSLRLITRIAALAMASLAVVSLIAAIRG